MKKFFSSLLLHYFRLLAKVQLLKNRQATIVGITGSAGKSSTLATCEAVLKDKFRVKTNGGSNSESGIPLSILGIKVVGYSPTDWLKYVLLAPIKLITNWQKFDIYLCEMGIDKPGDMAYLLTILKPKIGIFLNVNLVHGQNFSGIKDIALEKAKLINTLPSTGFALINVNDPLVSQTTQISLAKKIALKPIHLDFNDYAPPSSFDISIFAAINLANIFQINQSEAIKSLQKYLILPPSRCSILPGINNSTIIDSSYNSSPLACEEMLQVLAKYKSPRIAVLGDMRELGASSESAHQNIYRVALKSADTIISVGPETTRYFGPKAIKFTYWWQANKYIKEHHLPHSTILIKGSQNTIYLEEIVKNLSTSTQSICRQSPYWLKLKQNFRSMQK